MTFQDYIYLGTPLYISCLLFNFIVFHYISELLDYKPTRSKLLYFLCIMFSSIASLTILINKNNLTEPVPTLLLLSGIILPALGYSLSFKRFDSKLIYTSTLAFTLNENFNNLLRKIVVTGTDAADEYEKYLSEGNERSLIEEHRISILENVPRNIASYLLLTVFMIVLLTFLKRKNWIPVVKSGIKLISGKLYLIILIFLTMMSLFFKFVMTDGHEQGASFLAVPIMVLCGYIIARIMRISVSEREQRNSTALLEHQFNDYVEHCNDVVRLNDEMRAFRHDMKNHLICLSTLIEENEINRANEYIKNMENMTESVKKKYDTGNVIADALLSKKSEKAKDTNTKIVFDGVVPTMGIANPDLCIIMANAVDNAIEACAKDESGSEKTINIDSNFRQGYFLLRIVNPVFDKVEIKNGNQVRTSKKDTALHGFGVANIVKTVKKYAGETILSEENGLFTLDVSLQLKPNA